MRKVSCAGLFSKRGDVTQCVYCESELVEEYRDGDEWVQRPDGRPVPNYDAKTKYRCLECLREWTTGVSRKRGYIKEKLTFKIDFGEWRYEVIKHGKTNGKRWAKIKIFADDSETYFASVFGKIVDDFVEGNIDDEEIIAELTHDKDSKGLWKMGMVINEQER